MQGLGSFMKETRTLCVSDFLLPMGENITPVLFEVLWRFFSCFGQIEVIFKFIALSISNFYDVLVYGLRP